LGLGSSDRREIDFRLVVPKGLFDEAFGGVIAGGAGGGLPGLSASGEHRQACDRRYYTRGFKRVKHDIFHNVLISMFLL
jgi:hypothetical protein